MTQNMSLNTKMTKNEFKLKLENKLGFWQRMMCRHTSRAYCLTKVKASRKLPMASPTDITTDTKIG